MANIFQRFAKLFRGNVKFQDVDQVLPSSLNGSFFSKANVAVNNETANKLSTYYSCIRNISEDIAKQQIKILRLDSKGNRTNENGHNVYKLLNLKPNDLVNPTILKQTIVKDALERGNGYLFIERDDNGYPVALYNLNPLTVVPKIVNRRMYYIVNDVRLGIYGTFTSMDVFHLRGMGDRFVGESVLKNAAVSLGKAIATQDYASEYFGGGANMTGLISAPNLTGDEEQAKKFKQAFINSYKNDGLAMIGSQATFTKMSFSADEAQMLEAQEFNINDVCRWFRMPLSKVQKSETISNIEQLNIEYVNDCLSPWQVRLEQEIEAKLFDSKEKQMYDAKCDNRDLLRGDSASQERHIKTLYYTGAINANEIRSIYDMNNIGEMGDNYFNPVNMIPDDYLNVFWQSKDNKIPQSSADSSGSGANNNNIKNG